MTNLLLFLVHAQLNVLRGGWPKFIPEPKLWWGLLTIPMFYFLGTVPSYAIDYSLFFSIMVGLLLWAGHQLGGWGAYVGALIGHYEPHKEIKWIDTLIKPLEKTPKIWGFFGLTLRGLQWGLPLALLLLSPLPLIAGGLMGVVYAPLLWLGTIIHKMGKTLCKSTKLTRIDIGWLWSEWVHGGLLGLSLFI
jgi:hypothetical protein